MNKICVYAIAKNEELNVEQWVASMQSADHIIVLDTGSTDNTVSLLRSLGVEVHEKTYEHFRFDTARNDSLDLVPDEYNIRVCTDLDERFEQSNWADLVREYWDENKPRMIYNYVWSHNEDGSNGLDFIINKIHGTDPDLRWLGAVHEHLTFMSTGQKMFYDYVDMTLLITLHHYSNQDKDRMFYLDLMKERLEENPDDGQGWILYGNEQKVKGNPIEAIKAYQYIINNLPQTVDITELAAAYYGLGQCYTQTGQGAKAVAAYAEGIGVDKFYRDNYYGLGYLFIENQLYDMGIGVLEEALKTTTQVFSWAEDPFTWTYGVYDLLGYAYFCKNDIKTALGYAAKALSYDTSNQVLIDRYNTYLNAL